MEVGILKRFIIIALMLFSLVSTSNAGFFSSLAGGVAANSITGSNGRGSDGSSKTYFVILNKKINTLDLEVKILLGMNALSLILMIFIFLRQRKYISVISSVSEQITIEKKEK